MIERNLTETDLFTNCIIDLYALINYWLNISSAYALSIDYVWFMAILIPYLFNIIFMKEENRNNAIFPMNELTISTTEEIWNMK